jgi:hypothetical protein
MATLDDIRKNLKAGKPQGAAPAASSKTDPLASIRAQVKGSKPTSATPSPTSSYTNLLIAIAHANGHSQPQMWAQNVESYLKTL